jgi:hypothetical protein
MKEVKAQMEGKAKKAVPVETSESIESNEIEVEQSVDQPGENVSHVYDNVREYELLEDDDGDKSDEEEVAELPESEEVEQEVAGVLEADDARRADTLSKRQLRNRRVRERVKERKAEARDELRRQIQNAPNVGELADEEYRKSYGKSTDEMRDARSERFRQRHGRDGKVAVSMFAYDDEDDMLESLLTAAGKEPADISTASALFAELTAESNFYWDWDNRELLVIQDNLEGASADFERNVNETREKGFRAVQGPRRFSDALKHPKWAIPALAEKTTITEKAISILDYETAKRMIAEGADVVNLFPVYEEKVKDGELVYKVRLVGDGRTHYQAGNTYAATPSRDEFRIFMHLIGIYDWEFYHIDELRAFLNAKYKGLTQVIAKLDNEFFQVINALYGLKTAPRDYQQKVIERLTGLGYTRLGFCRCIFVKREGDKLVFVFDYVDDYIWTGNCAEFTLSEIAKFREIAQTTGVITNPTSCLGMEIARDRETRTISLSMTKKVKEMREKIDEFDLLKRLDMEKVRPGKVPISPNHVIIGDDAFLSASELSETDKRMLTPEEIKFYLCIVGGLLWQVGIRWDILYAVLYLTWFTHKPRIHHLKVSVRVVLYMRNTIDSYPLVLGGRDPLEVLTYTDASLNTAPGGRSVIAYGTRLGKHAGLVSAKTRATMDVVLSSFEAELDGHGEGVANNEMVMNKKQNITGLVEAFKQNAATRNVLAELSEYPESRMVYSDNKAMIDFVKDEAQARGMRHASLRLYYVRQQVERGIGLTNVEWMSGKKILANAMTKAVLQAEHIWFSEDVQGHKLLGKKPPGSLVEELED